MYSFTTLKNYIFSYIADLFILWIFNECVGCSNGNGISNILSLYSLFHSRKDTYFIHSLNLPACFLVCAMAAWKLLSINDHVLVLEFLMIFFFFFFFFTVLQLGKCVTCDAKSWYDCVGKVSECWSDFLVFSNPFFVSLKVNIMMI